MNPFRGRTVAILVAVAGVSLLAALLWWVFGPELLPSRSSGADSFSRSALGHRAFVELLRELEVPAVVSRFDSARRAREGALLVVAEPVVPTEQRARMLRGMLSRDRPALLVLPKWRGRESDEEPAFIESAELMNVGEVEDVLHAIGVTAEVVRLAPGPVEWEGREVAVTPSIDAPQVLSHDGAVRGIIRCGQGSLFSVVRTPSGSVYILSDPDLISNHGLARPGNAQAVMGILGLARRDRDAVVVDETLHGFGKEPSLFRALFEFPFGLATIQALLAASVLLWAAMGRFGAPQPADPPLEAGKKALIGNIAALLAVGGHGAHALRRYLDGAVAEVRAALHVPPEMKAAEAEARLDGARGTTRLRALRAIVKEEGRGDRRHVLATALKIHRWREEMIRGRADEH